MKKVLIISFLIFTILIGLLSPTLLATTITEEALESAFLKYVEENDDDSSSVYTMNIDKENKQINFFEDNKKIMSITNYDLSNLTFETEITIDNSTTYEDFQNKYGELLSPMIMFMLVSNINNVSYEDSMLYFAAGLLKSSFDDMYTSDTNKYTIIEKDDITTITDKDGNNIPVSKFSNYAVDIAKDFYKNDILVDDSESNNIFKYSIKIVDSSENSCKIQSELNINSESDFSKLNGYADNIEDPIISAAQNAKKEYENKVKQEEELLKKFENSLLNSNQSLLNKHSKLPQTGDSFGLTDVLYLLCISSSIALVYIVFKIVKYRNIEE